MKRKKRKVMSKTSQNTIEYLVVFIREFAKRFSLTDSQAFRYMKRFGGIGVVIDHYDIMHTLSMDDTIDDMSNFCRRAGGKL